MGHDRMKELAEAGGGAFYEVDKLEDLAGAYERVVADLERCKSCLSPGKQESRWKMALNPPPVDRTDAVARGKHGYYAN
jgi:hypothetical protein